MANGRQSAREKTESQFLLITGILVTLLGGPAFFSLVREPSPEIIKVTKQESRSPASIDHGRSRELLSETHQSGVREMNSVVQLHCSENTPQIVAEKMQPQVQAATLRIAGVGCRKESNIAIQNKTNGFTAAVIFTQENQFTTDYINLNPGDNELELVSQFKGGKKVTQRLKINRRVPASIK